MPQHDLASFILERLAEEEFIARAAGGNRWAMMADLDEVGVFAERKPGDETPDGKGWIEVAWWRHDEGVFGLLEYVPFADHIARHNPARVLADIEAKRAIVQCYTEAMAEHQIGTMKWMRVLKALAEPYRNHPDYPA